MCEKSQVTVLKCLGAPPYTQVFWGARIPALVREAHGPAGWALSQALVVVGGSLLSLTGLRGRGAPSE